MKTQNSAYIGNELELFKIANNWKDYWSSFVTPYIDNPVLEVGAGIGGTTSIFIPNLKKKIEWTALEPDQNLVKELILSNQKHKNVKIINGTLEDINDSEKFNTILYIDVIEHIENDIAELERASNRLKENGHLIILVPAHNCLFSPFDKAIGHYRRYNKKSLNRIIPKELHIKNVKYLDSIGMLLSLGNKLLLKQSYPTEKQILFWDKFIVKCSKVTDKILSYRIGKSLLLIAEKK